MPNKLRLLTPGPTPIPERVRLALARDMIHHRKQEFHAVMARVQTRLRELFGTKQPVLTLSSSGTGAMTAAIYSLFAQNEKVLVVVAGKFGERFVDIASKRGLAVTQLTYPYGTACNPADIEEQLEKDADIRGVLVQVSETSTGVLHPIREIAEITRKRDVLLVADGISAVGISPCPMDEYGIDCLLTGSQKGLMLPPGLSLLALSERAWARAMLLEPGCYYFDLPKERKKLENFETNFTTPVNLIVGLDESLAMLFEKGLDAVYAKQWALTMEARTGIKALGLVPFAKEHYTWGLTSVLLPEGVDGKDVLTYAQQEFGVCMAGGQGEMKGRIVRIGHMGYVDWADVLAGLYALDQGIIHASGFSLARDYLERAMAAYHEALAGTPGQTIPQVFIRS